MLTQQLPEVARLLPHECDVGMLFQPRGDFLGKRYPINGQCLPRRHGMVLGNFENQRVLQRHLRLEQSVSVFDRATFEGIATHQFRATVRLVCRSHALGAHLKQRDRMSSLRQLPRRFRSG